MEPTRGQIAIMENCIATPCPSEFAGFRVAGREGEHSVEGDLIDRIIALFAHDRGATDSGIKDDIFKRSLKDRPDIHRELMQALLAFSPEEGYTIESAADFVDWVRDELRVDV